MKEGTSIRIVTACLLGLLLVGYHASAGSGTIPDGHFTTLGTTTQHQTAGSVVVTGLDSGGPPLTRVWDVQGPIESAVFNFKTVSFSYFPYEPRFSGGVRVAVGDVNGDGVPDTITAPGPNGKAKVEVFSGVDQSLLSSFIAFPEHPASGVYVAAADLNGDGKAEIITGLGEGASPEVKIFNGETGQLLTRFLAYEPGFTGGVRVAVGDVNGDGKPAIITGPGPVHPPVVNVLDGTDLHLIASFFAFDPSFTGGVYVAAGDINGDGKADIIVGQGQGHNPEVRIYDASKPFDLHQALFVLLPYIEQSNLDGARVASFQSPPPDGPHIFIAPGPSKPAPVAQTPPVKIYRVDPTTGLVVVNVFFADPPGLQRHGVFIGVSQNTPLSQ